MKSRGIRVKASGRLTLDRAFAVRLEFEGPLEVVKALLRRGFPYTLRFDGGRGDEWALTLNEDFGGSTMWRTKDPRETVEMLGCIVERGGFEEEYRVGSGSRTYVGEGFRRMSEEDRSAFREIVESAFEA